MNYQQNKAINRLKIRQGLSEDNSPNIFETFSILRHTASCSCHRHGGQRNASFYLRPARQRAHQADGEHGGERQDDCLYLRLPPSDGYLVRKV